MLDKHGAETAKSEKALAFLLDNKADENLTLTVVSVLLV